ncbi:hypothetical protein ASD82_04945 [Rhodanobacter sp. Root179]|nr:hypothetical protein ASD82_04945 [Rhodanobacter sp. Root179]
MARTGELLHPSDDQRRRTAEAISPARDAGDSQGVDTRPQNEITASQFVERLCGKRLKCVVMRGCFGKVRELLTNRLSKSSRFPLPDISCAEGVTGCICGLEAVLVDEHELADASGSQQAGNFTAECTAPNDSNNHLGKFRRVPIVVASVDPGMILAHDLHTNDRSRAEDGVAPLLPHWVPTVLRQPSHVWRTNNDGDLHHARGRHFKKNRYRGTRLTKIPDKGIQGEDLRARVRIGIGCGSVVKAD